MDNGARPKATKDESKKSDLEKFKTRERFDEIFRVAVVGGTVRRGWWSPEKITIFSPQRIGKSRLVRSLCDQEEEEYENDEDTFIVDFFRTKINVDNLRIKLEIW